jgi:hypothetical protein
MARFHIVAGLAAALLASAPALAQPKPAPPARPAPPSHEAEDRALARWTSPTLTRFESEEEFRRFLAAARAAARARHLYWASARRIQFAQAQSGQAPAQPEPPVCDPAVETCPDEITNDAPGAVTVTGRRVPRGNLSASSPITTVSGSNVAAGANASITNTQEVGVDEGDIVKQIGQFLLILQDGRIFVVDTRAGRGGRGLRLTDRVNVYRSRQTGAWYDEMLVERDRVVVTAYSYDQRATEISVFRLDPRGRLSALGVFYMSSNDYYSGDNYATRLVGENLVVYSPMDLRGLRADSPIPWPLIRRWTPDENRAAALARGVRMFDARTIYRPVRTTFEPTVHTVSVCPLGPTGAGGDLACRTTAFIGPSSREYYVSPGDAYLWITSGHYDLQIAAGTTACTAPAAARTSAEDVTPALLYRLPLSGGPPSVIGAAGIPINQFSLAEIGGRFHALLRRPGRCAYNSGGTGSDRLVYFSTPLARLRPTLAPAPAGAFTQVPSAGLGEIENRFTDTHLVYGGRATGDPGGSPRDEADPRAKISTIVVLPVNRPRRAVTVELPHSVIRAERAGNNIVLTGYRGTRGLEISLLNLRGRPRISSTVRLEGRFESEGRSHAFNSLIGADGSGLMGLPTVVRSAESERLWWRSQASDLSYLRVDAAGRLRRIGELVSRVVYDMRSDSDGIAGYECEVSCIDWYGNSRPIFTDGRIFGLTGTELIEGRSLEHRISEVQRVNIALSRPPPL